jgi:hypothetical protein
MDVIDDGMVMEENFEQFAKHSFPKDVTDEGMFIDVSLPQYAKQ